MDRRHWILSVMDAISDPSWWDGVILGLAVAAACFIAVAWWLGW